jgi:hypothetical protein
MQMPMQMPKRLQVPKPLLAPKLPQPPKDSALVYLELRPRPKLGGRVRLWVELARACRDSILDPAAAGVLNPEGEVRF